MTFGLHTVTDAGPRLIDESFKTLIMTSKVTVVTDTAHTFGSKKEISYSGANPQIALRSNGNYVGIDKRSRSGGTYTAELVVDGPIGTSITYYVFEETPASAPSGFGLAVWDGGGTLVFNSNDKHLRVQDMLSGSGDSGTYTVGRTYAVVLCNGIFHWTSTGNDIDGWERRRHLHLVRVNNNVVDIDRRLLVSTSGWPTSLVYLPGFDALVVDVTNY